MEYAQTTLLVDTMREISGKMVLLGGHLAQLPVIADTIPSEGPIAQAKDSEVAELTAERMIEIIETVEGTLRAWAMALRDQLDES